MTWLQRGMLYLVAIVAVAGGCRKPRPATPPPEQSRLEAIEVKKDAKWLHTHVAPDGTFTTVDDPAAIPEASRRLVRVVDSAKGIEARKDTTTVYVIDARELLAKGKTMARAVSREAFETGAIAQLPPGASSLLAERPHEEAPVDAGAALPADAAAVVTLYGTSWCGACKAARQYLLGKKIPFVEKDVERDPAAARELGEKAARLGVSTDRVPILDVRGRLLVGFDPARLEALLGEAT